MKDFGFGNARFIAERRNGESGSDTIKRAGTALFDARRGGRNRYEAAP